MTVEPLVSVVLPVHNAGGYLPRAAEQLGNLDRSIRYEFILIDDHSDDDSLTIVQGWRDSRSLPGQIVVLEATARGVANARNQALRACTGDYVWLADADDEWDPRLVVEMCGLARDTNADVVVCNAVKRSPGGSYLGAIDDALADEMSDGPEGFARLLNGTLQGHLWNKLFTRSILGTDPFPATRAHSDLGGLLRILPRAARIAYLPQALYVYMQNPGSILNSAVYDFSDLRQCLDAAVEETRKLGASGALRAPLLHFKFNNVILPSLNEAARRWAALDKTARIAAAERTRRQIRWRELGRCVGRERLRVIAQATLAKISPRLYVSLYRRMTAREPLRPGTH